ncbi:MULTISPECIES: hypothetical protein [Streptococcus]|uniref:Uncharacterized protein n=1 Tax=Streptococcus agalactiae MRI Z1-216 TaxID=1154879 RepID=A0AAD3A2N4_STRAG|nr:MULTISPECIES: hypothetical protein [Streptococcus]EFY03081.1 hypothetical protein SDD27957_07290 [Streptococcus dysgalactiae subsp. dysgalactiae ATCC 27957]QBX23203.1 hypothetical protein Javan118_0030 [Streptococcus phage Javan118]EPU37769.1 hypothetical protein SAG0162_07735 [Streptococcus agalactiae MRI Z1-214]EPU38145.1 hypothetical protein SAG0164_00665 [Streptococcus agalactiae MRI Z1-216]EPX11193.1 hypothetical protein SAG0165_11390 [Streptococcus agalactiae MRI Z1-217]
MDLKKYHNKSVRVRTDEEIYEGVAVFNDKDDFEEEFDSLSIKTDIGWSNVLELEIKSIEII